MIDNIRESDAGIYICMVLGGQSEKHVTLKIQCKYYVNMAKKKKTIAIGGQ